jgi:hypothetical protein
MFRMMKVPVRVPCFSGVAWNSGAWRIVKLGAKPVSSPASGRTNMLRTNAACHAFGMT